MASPDPVSTWELLVRFHRSATTLMDEHLRTRHGRTLDDYDVLHQIHQHDGPIKMGDLAERLLLAKSSCNRIVGRLVTDGHVERAAGEHDRREVVVSLTTQGKRLRRSMAATHTRDIIELVGARLSEREVAQLQRALQSLQPTPSLRSR